MKRGVKWAVVLLVVVLIVAGVLPVIYCYMDDLAQWFKRKFSRKPPVAADDLRQEGEAHAV